MLLRGSPIAFRTQVPDTLPGLLYHHAPETMSRRPSPSKSPGAMKIARLGRAASMTWRAQRLRVSRETTAFGAPDTTAEAAAA